MTDGEAPTVYSMSGFHEDLEQDAVDKTNVSIHINTEEELMDLLPALSAVVKDIKHLCLSGEEVIANFNYLGELDWSRLESLEIKGISFEQKDPAKYPEFFGTLGNMKSLKTLALDVSIELVGIFFEMLKGQTSLETLSLAVSDRQVYYDNDGESDENGDEEAIDLAGVVPNLLNLRELTVEGTGWKGRAALQQAVLQVFQSTSGKYVQSTSGEYVLVPPRSIDLRTPIEEPWAP